MNAKQFSSRSLILVMLTSIQLHLGFCQLRKRNFLVKHGQRVTAGGTEIARVSKKGMTSVGCAVLCSSGCGLYEFNHDLELCVTFAQRIYEVAVTFDTQWKIGYRPIDSDLTYGNWTLVFRLHKEVSIPAYVTWTKTRLHHDKPMDASYPLACVSLYNYSSCDRHFRSHIMDEWDGISEVYLSVIKNEKQVAFAQFDGTGTNFTSWFDASRITNSTWVPSHVRNWEFTSIPGYCKGKLCRRFYLYGHGNNCGPEWLYFVVFDRGSDGCGSDWVKSVPKTLPSIAYSPASGLASFTAGYRQGEFADAMAVYVKFA